MKYRISISLLALLASALAACAQTRTLNNFTELNATPAGDDWIYLWDTSASTSKRISPANLMAGRQPLDSELTSLAGLVAPGADRIVFWDHSALGFRYLQLGTNLSITDTTINATGGGDSWTHQGAWADATVYALGDVVTNGGGSYVATTAHTAGALTEPGVGDDWATVWGLLASPGATGSFSGGENEIAFDSAVSDLISEPGFEYNPTTNIFTAPIIHATSGTLSTPSPMVALVMDISKEWNTKTLSGNATFTWSATPTVAGQQWGGEIQNSSGGIITVTLPNSPVMKTDLGVADNNLTVAANGRRTVYFRYDGTNVIKFEGGGGSGVSDWSELTGIPALVEDVGALTDPSADRIGFWDDDAGTFTWLTPGTGLDITGTTMTAPGFQEVGAFTGTGTYSEGVLYSGTMNADATLTFTLAAGERVAFDLDVTGSTRTLTFGAAYRVGYSGGTITTLALPVGRQRVQFYYNGTQYTVTDSVATAVDLTADVTGTLPVANGGTGTTTSTGSGSVVRNSSPTLTTPIIGAATATTPSAGDNDTSVATTAFVQTEVDGTATGSWAAPYTAASSTSPTWSGPFHAVYMGVAQTVILPDAAAYANRGIIVYSTGSFVLEVDPDADDYIVRDGTAQADGVTITVTAAAGNYVALISDGTNWITLGYKGTLAQGS